MQKGGRSLNGRMCHPQSATCTRILSPFPLPPSPFILSPNSSILIGKLAGGCCHAMSGMWCGSGSRRGFLPPVRPTARRRAQRIPAGFAASRPSGDQPGRDARTSRRLGPPSPRRSARGRNLARRLLVESNDRRLGHRRPRVARAFGRRNSLGENRLVVAGRAPGHAAALALLLLDLVLPPHERPLSVDHASGSSTNTESSAG